MIALGGLMRLEGGEWTVDVCFCFGGGRAHGVLILFEEDTGMFCTQHETRGGDRIMKNI